MTNELGFDDLVDVAVDILETSGKIGTALSDGIQITDLTVLFEVAPKAADVKKKGKQAVAELLDLTPDEAALAAAKISDRTGHPADGIIARVNEGFTLTVRTYRLTTDGYNLAGDWVRYFKSIKQQVTA